MIYNFITMSTSGEYMAQTDDGRTVRAHIVKTWKKIAFAGNDPELKEVFDAVPVTYTSPDTTVYSTQTGAQPITIPLTEAGEMRVGKHVTTHTGKYANMPPNSTLTFGFRIPDQQGTLRDFPDVILSPHSADDCGMVDVLTMERRAMPPEDRSFLYKWISQFDPIKNIDIGRVDRSSPVQVGVVKAMGVNI